MSTTTLEQAQNLEITKIALEFAAKAKEHPIGAVLGTLGLLAVHALYKSFRSSRAFSYLDGPEPPSFIWGHLPQLFDSGVMGEDQLWTADLRAMHEMVVKEHDSFRESEGFLSWIKLVSGDNLITVHGDKHKLQRKLLNPVFTPKHMRDRMKAHSTSLIVILILISMQLCPHSVQLPTMQVILEDIVTNRIQEGGSTSATVDIYKWMNYVALEMIEQGGMGHSFGVMENKESEYLKAAGRFFPTTFQLWYIRPFLPQLMKIGPRSFRRFIVEHTPFGPIQEVKAVSDVMDAEAVGIYSRKKEAAANGTLHAQVAAGKDIMTLLLKQNELMALDQQMTEDELVAQVNGFVFAGSDTTSTALARILHLLALYPKIQDTLRTEVSEAFQLYGSDPDYDQLNSLHYLDAVCRETLRLYPPVLFVERIAQKDWVLPLQHPIKSKDGKTLITEIPVKKGTNIYLSILAANRDKQTWGEDADQFKPSRWLDELPLAVRESKNPGVYSSTMTFLGGPRACIGFKFSQLEMKIVLAKLIKAFKFELGEHQIGWGSDGITKPYITYADGTKSPSHTMPMKVSIV
ncbi:unnamed protein product [Rhizoctonia solani]|uniref:Uncharacterized protein n=1 Tax=Rhizoctonia solani TaxID=456999 RepID=A0A8H3DLT3_9AGAM|nr:unnamed protein product [Rhizoctonia solani]